MCLKIILKVQHVEIFFFFVLPFCLYSQHSSNKHYLPVTFNITEISTIIFWLLLILFFIGVPNIHRFVSCVCSVLASIWCCFLFVAFKKSFICFPFRFISDKHCQWQLFYIFLLFVHQFSFSLTSFFYRIDSSIHVRYLFVALKTSVCKGNSTRIDIEKKEKKLCSLFIIWLRI